jgi:apolipoprotein D and lipocalin family protein
MKILNCKLFLFISTFLGCASNYAPLDVVNKVDLDRYLGKWYEISSFPQSFQKGCNCSTAEYFKTDDDYIKVVNKCRKDSPTGELKTANGKAFVKDTATNAKLSVQFFWPFRGAYWIIELANDYSYAVVGHPNREYLWILSRTPRMDSKIYSMLLEKISNKGFDTNKLVITNQTCND